MGGKHVGKCTITMPHDKHCLRVRRGLKEVYERLGTPSVEPGLPTPHPGPAMGEMSLGI